jgi:hypothetical protein
VIGEAMRASIHPGFWLQLAGSFLFADEPFDPVILVDLIAINSESSGIVSESWKKLQLLDR